MRDLKKYYYRISLLIVKKFSGEVTPEEEDILRAWRDTGKKQENCYRQIRGRLEEETKIYYREEVVRTDWKKVKRRISGESRSWRLIRKWGSYAALLFLLLGVKETEYKVKPETEKTSVSVAEGILPGKVSAILTLADGKEVRLHGQKQDSIRSEGVIIENLGGNLVYGKQTQSVIKELYNTVTVPQGGEYQITLADGTKVWMNAETTITYPIAFVGDERRVTLSGEAYFEVSENREKPFIITTDEISIKVLGTSFNINAYRNEENVVTTLLEGKVQILNQEQPIDELQPSEQAVWSRSSKELTTQVVDVSAYIQWLKGDFSFWDDDLETIMRVLARWYDMEYEFLDDELKGERFYGVLNRYREVCELLGQFEKTGKVRFQYEGKKIRIKK